MLSALRANQVLMICDKFIKVVESHRFNVNFLAEGGIFYKFIGAVSALAGFSVDKRVVEVTDVAGSYPNLRVHYDGGIETDI